ncbi:hypothetical protein TNCV_2721741 [Trichonephila clavipes]|nr:hypothetical protein TNCV_2721741 [Trichonephila clavipes]
MISSSRDCTGSATETSFHTPHFYGPGSRVDVMCRNGNSTGPVIACPLQTYGPGEELLSPSAGPEGVETFVSLIIIEFFFNSPYQRRTQRGGDQGFRTPSQRRLKPWNNWARASASIEASSHSLLILRKIMI